MGFLRQHELADMLLAAKYNGQPDKWAEMINKQWPYTYNTAKSPYDVWSGKYTQVRPRGATFLSPDGIEADYNKAKSNLLDAIGKTD